MKYSPFRSIGQGRGIVKQLYLSVSLAAIACADVASAQSSTEVYDYDALGRLISVVTTGGANDGDAHAICYDAAGNRTSYDARSNRAIPACAGGSTSPPPPPPSPPPPPPPPANNPPVAADDFASVTCTGTGIANLTVNDSDPDGDSLSLLSITRTSGGNADASIANASSVSVVGDSQFGSTTFTYVVSDGKGGTDSGQLSVLTGSCGGGPFF